MVQKNPLKGNKFIEVYVVRNGERLNTSTPNGLKHGNREIYFLGVGNFGGTISGESEYNMEQLNLLYTGKPCIFTDKVADSVDAIRWSDIIDFSRDGFSLKEVNKIVKNLYGVKKGDVIVAESAYLPIMEDGSEPDHTFYNAQQVVEEDRFFFKKYGYSKAFKTNFKGDKRISGLVSLFRKNGFNVKIVQDCRFPWRGIENVMDKLDTNSRCFDGAKAYFVNKHGKFARAYIFKDGVIVNSAEEDSRYADNFFPMGDNLSELYEQIISTEV